MSVLKIFFLLFSLVVLSLAAKLECERTVSDHWDQVLLSEECYDSCSKGCNNILCNLAEEVTSCMSETLLKEWIRFEAKYRRQCKETICSKETKACSKRITSALRKVEKSSVCHYDICTESCRLAICELRDQVWACGDVQIILNWVEYSVEYMKDCKVELCPIDSDSHSGVDDTNSNIGSGNDNTNSDTNTGNGNTNSDTNTGNGNTNSDTNTGNDNSNGNTNTGNSNTNTGNGNTNTGNGNTNTGNGNTNTGNVNTNTGNGNTNTGNGNTNTGNGNTNTGNGNTNTGNGNTNTGNDATNTNNGNDNSNTNTNNGNDNSNTNTNNGNENSNTNTNNGNDNSNTNSGKDDTQSSSDGENSEMDCYDLFKEMIKNPSNACITDMCSEKCFTYHCEVEAFGMTCNDTAVAEKWTEYLQSWTEICGAELICEAKTNSESESEPEPEPEPQPKPPPAPTPNDNSDTGKTSSASKALFSVWLAAMILAVI